MKRCGKEEYESLPLAYRLELAKLVPDFAEDITDEQRNIEVMVDKYRLYESIRLVMEKGERGRIFIVDNIQWIDKESIEVLKYLMRSLKDNPITFVLLYRVEEMTDDLEEFLSYISREVTVTDIVLKPFTHAEIKDSVKAIIGEEPDPLLVDYVIHESGGIPFYIEEIMKGLVDQRFLIVEEDAWVFSRPEKEIVPKSLGDIAIRKYRTLSSEARRVVDTATVIGWFDVGIIKKITDFNEGEILGVINHMDKLGMIKYKNERFEFDEEVSRHALYEKNVAGIPSIELHRRIGMTLEQENEGKETNIAEILAYHYYRSHETKRGVQYCMEAAARAQEKYANQYAIRYYTWALELLHDAQEPEDMAKRIDCLYKRAQAYSVIGENDKALQDLDESLKNAVATNDKKRNADILLRRAGICHRLSQYREAIAEATKSKKLYESIDDGAQMAFALNAIGYGHWSLSENEQAMASYEQAMSIFKELDDKRGEADTLNNFGTVYLGIDFSRALQYYEHSLRIYNEIGNKVGASRVCNNIGILYNQLGKYERALEYLKQSLSIQQERGSKHGEETAYVNIGNIYSARDENKDALKFYELALKIARITGNKESEGICLNNIGLKLDTLGEYQKAMKSLERTVAITQEIGDKRTEAAALTGLGQIHQHLGEYDDAKSFYARALQIGEEQNVSWVKFGSLVSQGEFYLLLGENEKAKKYIDAAHALSQEVASQSYIAATLMLRCEYHLSSADLDIFMETMNALEQCVEKYTDGQKAAIAMMLGRYHTMKEEFEEAETQLTQALKINKKIGNRLQYGKSYYYRGMMERARKGDRVQEFLAQAVEIFDALGAKAWKQKAQDHLIKPPPS
jgi:tetratricopeptide (TPR) repeat protein